MTPGAVVAKGQGVTTKSTMAAPTKNVPRTRTRDRNGLGSAKSLRHVWPSRSKVGRSQLTTMSADKITPTPCQYSDEATISPAMIVRLHNFVEIP